MFAVYITFFITYTCPIVLTAVRMHARSSLLSCACRKLLACKLLIFNGQQHTYMHCILLIADFLPLLVNISQIGQTN
jgi:hypothetical protein